MTREERDKAKDIFEHNWTRIVNGDYTEEELNTAISKALEALDNKLMIENAFASTLTPEQAAAFCDHYCRFPHEYDEERHGVPLAESHICKNCPITTEKAPKRGRWTNKCGNRKDGYEWTCSECKKIVFYTTDFCPHCGAIMNGGKECKGK